MNILYVMQQSIYNNDGKWLSADSNINMFAGFARELVRHADWRIYVLIAPLPHFADINSYDEIFKHEQITYIPYTFPINAFKNRQNFSTIAFDSILDAYPSRNVDFDIVINNITELSRNIKTLLVNRKANTKLITQCFWIDAPEIGEPKVPQEISYDWRQVDGFECSDLAVFTCESTKAAFIHNALAKFNKSIIDKIENKSVIWDFGYSQDEGFSYSDDPEMPDKVRILFLNRLSAINYAHHREFIDTAHELYAKRQDFEVVFTNPSQKTSLDLVRGLCEPVICYKKDKSLSREEYWKLLYSGDISVHLFTIERYGGCALRESIHAGNIPVVANVFEQKRIVGDDFPQVRITPNKEIDTKSLLDTLDYAIDFAYSLRLANWHSDELDNINKRNILSSFEVMVPEVIKDIERTMAK